MKKQSFASRLLAARQRRIGLLCSALASAVLCNSALATGSIGLSFVSGSSENLTAAEQAGAPGYVQANWNNGGSKGTNVAVIDASGVASGVLASWSANGTWGNNAGTTNADGKLMHGYLDSTGAANENTTPYNFSLNANRPEVYFENLSAWMNSQGAASYDVVVYVDGDSTSGRIGEYWLQKSTGKGTDNLPNGLGEELTPHVFASDMTNFTGTYMQIPLTGYNTRTAGAGNYIVFPGVVSDNFILRTEERYTRAGINAVQIVPRATIAAPAIVMNPESQVKYVGGKAVLSVGASGSGPLRYQWVKSGAGDVLNATNQILTLSNLSSADNGSQYYVVVQNNAGIISSDAATITVLDMPPANYYATTVLTNSPVSYVRFSEDNGVIYDYAGSHNGFSGSGAFGMDYGLSPGAFMGFESGNMGWVFSHASSEGSVCMPSAMNLRTNAMTIVAWVMPIGDNGAQASWTGIVMSREGSSSGLTYTDTKNELGYLWNGYYSFHSGLVVPDSQWSMVAMVVETNKVTLYVVNPNTGLLSASSVRSNAPAIFNGDLYIGTDPGFKTTRGFGGSIDEVAIFDKSLSNSQIMALYAAGRAAGSMPPVIAQQPVSKQVYAGKTVSLSVNASGVGNVTYQWKTASGNVVDGGRISGAKTSTLTFTNVTTAEIGSYFVEVSNPAGTVTSDPATLNVVTPSGQPYETAVIAANPVAYWRLNELSGNSAFENINGFTGIYGGSALMGVSGPVTPDFGGFESSNTGVQSTRNVANSYVSVSGLNLNTNRVTFAGWIYSTGDQDGAAGIIFSRSAGTVSGICYRDKNLSYTWNDAWDYNTGFEIPVNEWVFVAMVVEPTQGTMYLGSKKGLQKAVRTMDHVTQSFSGVTCIGADTFGDSRTFNGKIDEVCVFNRSLTDSEIAELYGKGTGVPVVPQITMQTSTNVGGWAGFTANFSATVLGGGTMSYQWYHGATALVDGGNVSGSKTLALTISNVTLADAGDYTLVVTSTTAGQATSPVCKITVGVEPSRPYHQSVLAANPVGYWRLNETTGTTAHDLVGAHDGTYGTAVQLGGLAQDTEGMYGFGTDTASARFTRATEQSWVTIPALNLNTNEVTMMAWVKPTTRPDNWSGIVVSQGSRAGMMFRDNTPNTLGVMWNGGDYWYNGTSLTVPVGQWSLVALTVRPTNATLYVMNSTGAKSWTNAMTMKVETFGESLVIGCDPMSDLAQWKNRAFDGFINNVAVFNRTLSAEDLQQFYSVGVTMQEAPLTVQIKKTESGVQLVWPKGTLYQADTVDGIWTPVSNATSPYDVTGLSTNKFYRVGTVN